MAYNTKPATSGPHWNLAGEAPVPWGIYKDPIPDEAFEVLTYLFGDAAPALLETYGAMPARKADQAAFFDALNKKYPQKPDWQVAIDSIAYADNPSFESNVPNFNEFLDRNSTFFTLMRNTPDLDLDKEIEKYKADLQAIFNKKS